MTLIGSLVCLIGIVKKRDSEMKLDLSAMTKENRRKKERKNEREKKRYAESVQFNKS